MAAMYRISSWRVLPVLAPGVLVHIHDISLPNEYPQHFDHFYYSEQYMLGAFLLFNPSWQPILPITYLNQVGIFPHGGASFWMKRIA